MAAKGAKTPKEAPKKAPNAEAAPSTAAPAARAVWGSGGIDGLVSVLKDRLKHQDRRVGLGAGAKVRRGATGGEGRSEG